MVTLNIEECHDAIEKDDVSSNIPILKENEA